LTITTSFHGGRTIACADVPAIVCRMPTICGVSSGVCSMSTTRKSKPMQPSASAADAAALTSHAPTGALPAAMARLNWLTGSSMEGPRVVTLSPRFC